MSEKRVVLKYHGCYEVMFVTRRSHSVAADEKGIRMNSKGIIRQGLLAVCACVLAIGVTVGLSGCAKSDEEEIRAAITTSMDMLKNPSEETLKPYVEESNIDLSALEDYGIDFYEFMEHCFKKLEYSVDSISIEGDKATAQVTTTNIDISSAATDASKEITENIGDYADILAGENAQQELMKAYMDLFYANVDASENMITNQTELTFTKKDGSWEVDQESVSALMSSMYQAVEI